MKQLLLVAAGGGLGAVARWAMGGWVAHRVDASYAYLGTLAVNLVGCLLAGVLAGVVVRNETFSTDARLFLMTGVLGGFTTFSAFGVDTVSLLRRHEFGAALGYVLVSVLGGIALLFATLVVVVRATPRGN